MARHWSEYAGNGLTDRQIKAADAIAKEHELGDGLQAIATANGQSRSKTAKELGTATRPGNFWIVCSSNTGTTRNGNGIRHRERSLIGE